MCTKYTNVLLEIGNSPVAIWWIVQQSYGLGLEAVKEPFGPHGAPVPLAVR
jgi:hypothetical protein